MVIGSTMSNTKSLDDIASKSEYSEVTAVLQTGLLPSTETASKHASDWNKPSPDQYSDRPLIDTFALSESHMPPQGSEDNVKPASKPSVPTSLLRPSGSASSGTDNQRKTVLVQPHEGKKFKVNSRPCTRRQKPPDITKTLNKCRESKAPVLDLSSQDIQQFPNSAFEDMTWVTSLYLYEAKLSSLPPSIGRLINLRLLMAQENLLSKLPPEIGHLNLLEQLDLRHNRLDGPLPSCLTSLMKLQHLLLTFNKLTSLDGIENLTHLVCLRVNQNCLRCDLPESIGQLSRLTQLDLSYNQITALPESIGCCRNLKTLNLQHNQLQRLPDSIGNLKNLCKLAIKYNQLEEIPTTLANCTELVEFNVENNQLSSIPGDLLLNLPKLQNISLSRNLFTTFPPGGPGQFRTCYSLNVDHNHIVTIPTSIFAEASKLTQLNLCENSLTYLVPSDLHHWKSIVQLDLGSNQLSSLPPEIGVLENLEVLELNLNFLSSLPDEIQCLSKLRILGLDSNALEVLPEDLSGLVSLQELNVLSNRLTTFPRSIGSLHKLKVIKAGENDIRQLPPELGNMQSLHELHLNDNLNLNDLPVELSLCKTLKILFLENCPLRDIERNVVEGGSAMIMYFLQQVIQFRHQTTV